MDTIAPKHTPGPWEAIFPEDGEAAVKFGTQYFAVSADPEYPISHEDARLIAAAPDMLAALKDALRYIEVQNAYRGSMTAAEVEAAIKSNSDVAEVQIGANSCNTLARFSFAEARAAIAKAEGR